MSVSKEPPPYKQTIPSTLLSNACHLTNKVGELRCVADLNSASIVIITESWLSSNIPSTAIKLKDSYITHPKDRIGRQSGVVVAYIQNKLRPKRLLNLEDDEKEVIWLKLYPKRLPRPFSCVFVAGIYFPTGKAITEGKEMINCLTQCPDALLNAQGVNEKVEIFTPELTSILDETMPMKTTRMQPSDKPWLTPHIKEIIKQRQRAYSKGDMGKYKKKNKKNYNTKPHN